ncbi:MAG: hypothetical protein KAR07_03035 [Spirochaetes bacterium]|nr:hypothetical protein [Spirochaetota bacterium]
MNQKNKTILKYSIGLPLGALLGYLYYYFIGCASGTCPITSSPLWSTLYGTVFMGALAGLINTKDKKEDKEKQK